MGKLVNDKYRVGSHVIITEYGYTYANNSPWILRNIPSEIDKFAEEALPENGYVCKILFIAPHSTNAQRNLYLLSYKNQVYIMDERGFKLYLRSFEVELL